jgi:peptidyl-prolyl cis-trans isomerase SurA
VLWLAGCVAAQAFAETANRIVAVVNDEVITETDVAAYVNALLEDQSVPSEAEADPAAVRQAALHRLIEEHLILQEARRAGISVAPEEVVDRLSVLRSRFDSDEAFRQSLVDSHLSEERLRGKLRDQLLVQRVIDAQVRSTVVVSPQEVARELNVHPELAKPGDRVRASHILLRVNDGRPAEQARVLIEDIHRQLTHGAEFSTLARRYSEDPYAEDGGRMDWIAQGELLPELDAALFSLKVGELSGPIQTRLGFHLVKVEERRKASSLSMTEANRAVYQRIYQQKFQERFDRWLAELKRRAYIDIIND